MILSDFDLAVREVLDISAFEPIDVSTNGLQVARKTPEISRVAFAVDAAMESFEQASRERADLLFVHHGLFWGRVQTITGAHFERLRFLIESDLALYAVHLPLDAHPELGNNIGIARKLGLEDIEAFGAYKGAKIGFKGRLPAPAALEQVSQAITASPLAMLPFGVSGIRTIGIVSGGDPRGVSQAIAEGLDLFITGDASHEIYHQAREARINVLFAGHYATEIWGVQQMSDYVRDRMGLETILLDIPTGL